MSVGLAAMRSCYKTRSARGASEHGVLPNHAIVPLTVVSVATARETDGQVSAEPGERTRRVHSTLSSKRVAVCRDVARPGEDGGVRVRGECCQCRGRRGAIESTDNHSECS